MSTIDTVNSDLPTALTKLDPHEPNIARTAESHGVCAASHYVDAVDGSKLNDDIISGLSNFHLTSTEEQ